MKWKSLFISALLFIIAINARADEFIFNEINSFVEAKPIWPQGQERTKNLTVSFRQPVQMKKGQTAMLKIAASTNYRAYVNGKFLAHGPCVAAHDYYRVDCYEMTSLMKPGENIVAIEVCGYNVSNFYLLKQPSFLQAEIELDGQVVAATGSKGDFTAYILNQRKQDVPRFSFQRPYTEYYILKPDFNRWQTDMSWQAPSVVCAVQPVKNLIARGVPYPDYTILQSTQFSDSIYAFERNSTGFIGFPSR